MHDSLSVFQKFFGPLFVLPGSLRWGFNTKVRADSVCCFLSWAPPSHQCSKSKDNKVVESQMCSKPHLKKLKGAKCVISWKVKLITCKFSLRRRSQNISYKIQLLFSLMHGIEKIVFSFTWATLTRVLLAFYFCSCPQNRCFVLFWKYEHNLQWPW